MSNDMRVGNIGVPAAMFPGQTKSQKKIQAARSSTSGYGSGLGGSLPDSAELDALFRKLIPQWASRIPQNVTELLRQLSANAGQPAMPGGQVGAVTQPAFGSTAAPSVMTSAKGYGQTSGEPTFFQQSLYGGMAPISANSPLGVPENWNPFNIPKLDITPKITTGTTKK